MSVLDDVNKYRHELVTDNYTVTWRELLGQYKDGDLVINPDYQRLFRWDLDQQTQYIESILLSIPSPPLFLAKNDDGRSEVIDGLQRISTVLKFFAADFPGFKDVGDDEVNELDQNDISRPIKLVAGRIVNSLEGFAAATLPDTLARTIRYARVPVILLEKESTKNARYEVFRRLNKFGSPLGDQEIRNCTARLLGHEFPDALRQLAESPVIVACLGLSDESIRRMGVEEMLLRLLALIYSEQKLKHQVREYLDDFMEFAAEGKFKLTEDIKARVIKSFELINQAVPDGRAFRLLSHGFSTNLFDVVATGVYQNIESLTPEFFAIRLKALVGGPELKPLIGAGSNTRKKLQGRIELGKAWFK
ncbi:DUF262 domain-containing protein [Ideonella sp.]|uniref:DUF262 domain-containing protein n=1 Tax=Ideonella sp. TaxID=1929293 RepID=UPI0035B4C3A9